MTLPVPCDVCGREFAEMTACHVDGAPAFVCSDCLAGVKEDE